MQIHLSIFNYFGQEANPVAAAPHSSGAVLPDLARETRVQQRILMSANTCVVLTAGSDI